MELLDNVVTQLTEIGKIDSHYKPHLLKGNFKGYWECHIQPVTIYIGRLLIWKQDEVIKLVTLTRTGTHSDLF